MKTLGANIYFQVEKETENTHTLSNGVEIWLDTDIDRMKNARQYGTVYSVPENLNKYKEFDDGVELTNGDKIYFHHFVVEPESKMKIFEDTVYTLPYSQIFAVQRGDDVTPTNDFVFAVPERKTKASDSIIDVNEGEMSRRVARVKYVGSEGLKIGLNVGDRILYDMPPYKMQVNGEELIKLRCERILAKIDDEIQFKW